MTIQPSTTPAPGTMIHPASDPDSGPWWRSAVVYQVYVRSFYDADADGYGDLIGLRAQLDYLAHLGVDAIWLNPFYRSAWVDGGFDVIDHCAVDPTLGTLADFDAVVFRAHELGLKVVIDLEPIHTSDQNPRFQAALAAGPGSGERNWYVFADGRGSTGNQPPTDWRSKFGGSAWTRIEEADGTRGQWYRHLFDVHEPDLNWSNPAVRAEFERVAQFWLERGVDGFRINNAHALFQDDGLATWVGPVGNETAAEAIGDATATEAIDQACAEPAADATTHHQLYRQWRDLVDSYPGDHMVVAEAWMAAGRELASLTRPGELTNAFSFEFLAAGWDAAAIREAITETLAAFDAVKAPAAWVLSNHDVIRHTTRLSLPPRLAWGGGLGQGDPKPDEAAALRRARAATLLMLALPGAAFLYQGEELGLPEAIDLPDEARLDPTWRRSGFTVRGRDGARVPLPWYREARDFGFTMGRSPYLPLPSTWGRYAADSQRDRPGSTYETYRTALWLRRRQALGSGSLAWVSDLPGQTADAVIAFTNRSTLVVTNLGTTPLQLPPGLVILHSSQDLTVGADGSTQVPPDTTLWAEGL